MSLNFEHDPKLTRYPRTRTSDSALPPVKGGGGDLMGGGGEAARRASAHDIPIGEMAQIAQIFSSGHIAIAPSI